MADGALVLKKGDSRLKVDCNVSIRELQATLAHALMESSDLIGLLKILKGITWKTHPKAAQVTKLTQLALEFLEVCPNTKISQPKLKTAIDDEN